jgi:hypothetical protein
MQRNAGQIFELWVILLLFAESHPAKLLIFFSCPEGKWSTAQNSFARKPVFQANLQISLAVFETAVFETCMADMLG